MPRVSSPCIRAALLCVGRLFTIRERAGGRILGAMSDATTYVGSCHCGKVHYEVTMALGEVVACNCSMCGRTGTLLAFVPATQFTLKSGDDALRDYQFAKKHIHHLFCTTCGVKSFARGSTPDGRELVAVNVRCLDGVDVASLSVKHFDGRIL
jgi:hypothetical protein